jgi:hypothetical protein
MKHLAILLISILNAVIVLAKPVTQDEARTIADIYFLKHCSRPNLELENSFSVQFNGIMVYHVFNYKGGGFVAVAADDAVTPVLAQSETGFLERNITNPDVKYWFEGLSREIETIVLSNLSNSETLSEWNRILNNAFDVASFDVGPLLSSSWDQGEWYNYYCPVDPAGPGGHAWAGCVATAMGQIMKYYNFPDQGVLSYSYTHPTYGIQSVSFKDSTLHWESMGTTAYASDYLSVASLLYQIGISVEMDYGITGSGARTNAIPWAFTTYFNYDPTSIELAYKSDYDDNAWKELLKAELFASRPLCYGGNTELVGHQWVCDGWRSGDDMFHMNWGWSGSSNGWYKIGALNPWGGGSYNQNNDVIKGIKPGNPDLIARITNLKPYQVIGYGPAVEINCSVEHGQAENLNLYFDSTLVFSTSQANFTYYLHTTDFVNGLHKLTLEAENQDDTAYHIVTVMNNGWVSRASAFNNFPRGINYIHTVDSLVAWATDYDGTTPSNPIQEFTRTSNGGETWISGMIPDCSGLSPSMIFALDASTAYCPMFRQSGSNPQGIYMTVDGGVSWTRQVSAGFSNTASFPNIVHFFDSERGVCMGDPINGEFEIYTTADAGNTWSLIPSDNIPNPVSGENGVAGWYSAFGNHVWFGTNKGRVYHSNDSGLHWSVNTTTLAGKWIDVEFADELHGIAQDRSLGASGALSETYDGGTTWNNIAVTGPVGKSEVCFVPGTINTWISTNSTDPLGAFYSYDGGHSWAQFPQTGQEQFIAVDFFNERNGYAGSFNTSPTNNGIFKFVGVMPAGTLMGPVSSLYSVVTGKYVHLEWSAPYFGNVTGYNIYRNDTLLNSQPWLNTVYDDVYAPDGLHIYCVSAVYSMNESEAVCTEALINMSPAANLNAVVTDNHVSLEWTAPSTGNVTGYNVYRDNTLLNSQPVFSPVYDDLNVPGGQHTYCVRAVYSTIESEAVCTEVLITYGIPENQLFVKVFPNPSTGIIIIRSPYDFCDVTISNLIGQDVYHYETRAKELKILTSGIDPGIYILKLMVENKPVSVKISVQ